MAELIGQVVELADEDFKYGVGPIYFHVVKVGDRRVIDRVEWLELMGYTLSSDGRKGRLRSLIARVAGIRVAG